MRGTPGFRFGSPPHRPWSPGPPPLDFASYPFRKHGEDHLTDPRGKSSRGHPLEVPGIAFDLAVLVGNTIGMGMLRTVAGIPE